MMRYVICLAIIIVAAIIFRFGLALLRADKLEVEKNASRVRTWKDAIFGRVQIHDDWLPDARVQGGMIFNEAENRIEICGRLSDESLERTFR